MAKYIERKVIRGVIYKRCACCGDYKPESEFNLRNDTSDKIQYYCRACNKSYCKDWIRTHKSI